MGEIGLTVDYFYSLTPRQWSNTEKGYYAKELILMKDRWIQTRKVMWAVLMPNAKNLKESEVLSFPWDAENGVEFTDEDHQALLDEVEKVKAFYDAVDAKKATAKTEKWNLKE